MPLIGTFEFIHPKDWLCKTHGDVQEAMRRAENWYKENGSYEGAEYSIEEFVRQWALKKLLDEYKYPSEWI